MSYYIYILAPIFKGSSTNINQNSASIPMINITLTNAAYLVIGTITLLKQFNPNYRNQFIAILSQYVRSCITLNTVQRSADLPVDISKVVSFLEEFIHFSDLDKKILEVYIPKYIIDQYLTLVI